MISKEEIQQEIEKFKKEINLPEIRIPEEISVILNFSRQELKIRNKEDLAIDIIRLAQYSIYLKLQLNRYRAVTNWCDANINSIVGRELQNTNGYGYIEKSTIIKRNDKDANNLVNIKVFAETKIHTLEDVDRKLEFMAQSMKGLIFQKD